MTQVTLNNGSVDSSGSLLLKTNGTTTAVTVDTAQNVGVGVTPSAWISSAKAIQISSVGSVSANSNSIDLSLNRYVNSGGTSTYIASAAASLYEQYNGGHYWYTAASGTAGNPITFTQAMTLDASGNLGLGTSSPDSNAGYAFMTTNGSSGSGYHAQFNGTTVTKIEAVTGSTNITAEGARNIQLYTNGSERARIDSSGNLLFSNATYGNTNSVGAYIAGRTATTNGHSLGSISIQSGSANYYEGTIVFSTSPTINTTDPVERARIDYSGNLLVGKTTSSETSANGFIVFTNGQVTSTTANQNTFNFYNTTASAYRFYVTGAGQINATSTSIAAISDVSLKENVRDLETGLSQVLALQPRRFDWKAETGLEEKNVAGFIAQELEQVLPELVYEYQYNETETKKSIKMGDILPTLVKAIQEQQAIIQTLTERITALEGAK